MEYRERQLICKILKQTIDYGKRTAAHQNTIQVTFKKITRRNRYIVDCAFMHSMNRNLAVYFLGTTYVLDCWDPSKRAQVPSQPCAQDHLAFDDQRARKHAQHQADSQSCAAVPKQYHVIPRPSSFRAKRFPFQHYLQQTTMDHNHGSQQWITTMNCYGHYNINDITYILRQSDRLE